MVGDMTTRSQVTQEQGNIGTRWTFSKNQQLIWSADMDLFRITYPLLTQHYPSHLQHSYIPHSLYSPQSWILCSKRSGDTKPTSLCIWWKIIINVNNGNYSNSLSELHKNDHFSKRFVNIQTWRHMANLQICNVVDEPTRFSTLSALLFKTAIWKQLG